MKDITQYTRRKKYHVAFTEEEFSLYTILREEGWNREKFSSFCKRAMRNEAARFFISNKKFKADVEQVIET